MPSHLENGRKLDGKKSLQDFDAKEKYLHAKNPPVSIQKRRKMFRLHHCRVFTYAVSNLCQLGFCFQNPQLSKSAGKMCRFRVNGRSIRRIFHRFQMCWHRINAVLESFILQCIAENTTLYTNSYIYTSNK